MNSTLVNLWCKLEKGIFSFTKILSHISGVIIALMMILSAVDVVLRYIFHRPLVGTMALLEVMMPLFTALVFAYAESQKRHFKLDFLVAKLPQKIKVPFETTTDILALGMILIISIATFKYAAYIKMTGLLLGEISIPIYPYIYIVAIGWSFYSIIKIINIIKSIKEKGASFWIGALAGIVIFIVFFSLWKAGFKLGVEYGFFIGFVGIALSVLIALLGMEVGLSLIMVSFFGILIIRDFNFAFTTLGVQPYSVVSTYTYAVYPLFAYMGTIVFFAGIGEDLFKAVHKWFGHIPGGLAMATVTASAAFAAVSGSGVSNAITMGRVALPEMKRYKYHYRLAAGSIAAGGTLGPLIPPSTVFILYGILTQQPIGRLFIAGIIPGLLKMIIYFGVIRFMCTRHPDWGPAVPEKAPLKERIISTKTIWSVLMLFAIIMGGLYKGVFTPSEAAGMGAFGAVICWLLKGGFTPKKLLHASIETTQAYGATVCILIGAIIFGTFLGVTRFPYLLGDYISSLTINRYIIMTIFVIIMLFLGAIMDILSIIAVIIPVVFPVVVRLGFDPIWFGVLVCWLLEIGALTPPIGINVFALKNIAREVPLEDIFAGVAPFYIADMVAIILLIAFPQIATFLPDIMW